ncbi:MAG: hypothetical protein A2Y55_02045 [Actinobacteria bacterium RBG_16_68_12]|nr:MAG: hypothetical protein A2Y55_02045 [Actinobacteria bacterium RBG_16_68_12]
MKRKAIEGLKREQERIAEAEELMRIGLRLVQDRHEAYLEASPEVRRLWNEAVFSRIAIHGRRIASVEYREPLAALLSRSSGSDVSRRRTGRYWNLFDLQAPLSRLQRLAVLCPFP